MHSYVTCNFVCKHLKFMFCVWLRGGEVGGGRIMHLVVQKQKQQYKCTLILTINLKFDSISQFFKKL
jgi:hypothetical protein